jgi:hypothetical protein
VESVECVDETGFDFWTNFDEFLNLKMVEKFEQLGSNLHSEATSKLLQLCDVKTETRGFIKPADSAHFQAVLIFFQKLSQWQILPSPTYLDYVKTYLSRTF